MGWLIQILHSEGAEHDEHDVKYISGKWLLRVIRQGAVVKSIPLPELGAEGDGFYVIKVVDGQRLVSQGDGSDLLVKDILASQGIQPALDQSHEPSLLEGMEAPGSPIPIQNGGLEDNVPDSDDSEDDELQKLNQHVEAQDHTGKKLDLPKNTINKSKKKNNM